MTRSSARCPVRTLITVILIGLLLNCSATSASERTTLLILDLGMIDTTLGEPSHLPLDDADAQRLKMAADVLREALVDHNDYQLVDHRALDAAVAAATKKGQPLHRCANCQLAVAEALGAGAIMAGHVRKVSNLILVMNLELRDVRSGRSIKRGQIHMRGNTDESWRRAALSLLEHEFQLIRRE